MAKRMLIRESKIIDLLKGFLNIKAKGREAEFIQKIRKEDPESAELWSKWNNDMDRALMSAKNNFIKAGLPDKAKEIDDLIKKYS